MLSGAWFLVVFILVIGLMVAAIAFLRIHPFTSIISTAFLLGLLCVPLDEVVEVVTGGFGSTFGTIGLIVLIGSLIGVILERTGAALRMSDSVIRIVGRKHPDAGLAIMGWIASIAIFCDSGFVILDPVRRAIVKRLHYSSVSTTVALATGLFISHCLIPPTPGPVAAAGILGLENHMLTIMFYGAIVSIPALVVACHFARFIGKYVKDKREQNMDENEAVKTYEELVASYGRLPGAALSFAPIVLPLILMAVSSFCSMARFDIPLIAFLGKPVIAISVGFLASLELLIQTDKMKELYKLTNDSLQVAAPILFITGAGGALGAVVGRSPLIPFFTAHANVLQSLGFLFPFLFAAILKTAQGSSTVAITTTAGVVGPLLGTLGFDTPELQALAVTAMGAGAMTVSHVNDSYFWVVLNFGELTKTIDGYKTHVLSTLLVGLTSIITVIILGQFV
ncbi:MAG: GntP family permease [Thermoguttaceae bacterium]|nr:GntP family permease [Thermoguttaceae bacterium]